jgi:hypothetical protein
MIIYLSLKPAFSSSFDRVSALSLDELLLLKILEYSEEQMSVHLHQFELHLSLGPTIWI